MKKYQTPYGLLFTFFCLSCFSLLLPPAQAAVMLTGGLTHQHNVVGGQRITGVFNLRNTGNQPTEIKLYQEDRSPVGKNSGHERSNKRWIRLSINRVTLAAGASQRVTYTLNVPKSVRPGTYWSLIDLEPVPKKSRESQVKKKPNDPNSFSVGLSSKVRYAVNIMAHIQGGKSNLIFSAPKIETNTKGQKIFAMNIQNTGNRFSRPNISLEIFNHSGKSIKTLKGQTRGVYPQVKKRYEVSLAGVAPGRYKALFVAEDSHTGKTFGANVNLTVKP